MSTILYSTSNPFNTRRILLSRCLAPQEGCSIFDNSDWVTCVICGAIGLLAGQNTKVTDKLTELDEATKNEFQKYIKTHSSNQLRPTPLLKEQQFWNVQYYRASETTTKPTAKPNNCFPRPDSNHEVDHCRHDYTARLWSLCRRRGEG